MEANTIVRRNPKVVEAEVDGQRVLMSPKDFSYFGLVDTGALVWDRIDVPTGFGALVATLAAEYGVEPDEIEGDVADFIAALDSAGLLA